jgi:hypothetical protein
MSDDTKVTHAFLTDTLAQLVEGMAASLRKREEEINRRLAACEETLKSAAHRATRQSDHLASLETRTKRLERGREND